MREATIEAEGLVRAFGPILTLHGYRLQRPARHGSRCAWPPGAAGRAKGRSQTLAAMALKKAIILTRSVSSDLWQRA